MHTIYHTTPCISPQSISALRLILVSQADTWCNMKKSSIILYIYNGTKQLTTRLRPNIVIFDNYKKVIFILSKMDFSQLHVAFEPE